MKFIKGNFTLIVVLIWQLYVLNKNYYKGIEAFEGHFFFFGLLWLFMFGYSVFGFISTNGISLPSLGNTDSNNLANLAVERTRREFGDMGDINMRHKQYIGKWMYLLMFGFNLAGYIYVCNVIY